MRLVAWRPSLVVAGALLALASSAQAQQPSPATTAPLDLTVGGPLRAEAGRPLRLHLPVKEVAAFWRRVGAVAHQLAPAAPSDSSPTTTAAIDVMLKWTDGAAEPLAVPFRDSVAEVLVGAGKERTGGYSLTWIDPAGRLAIRLPAAGEYRVEIVQPGPTAVLAGTGSQELVVFGEEVPIVVELQDPLGVTAVTVSHRSVGSGPFATAPMKLDAGDGQRGTWKYGVPRPQSAEAILEYFAEIENKAGGRTSFGSARLPYRLRLPDPTAKP